MMFIDPSRSKEFFRDYVLNIESLEKVRSETLIFETASEHWGEDNYIVDLHNKLLEGNFDFWVLSHHPGDHKKLERLIYYPWWGIFGVSRFEKIDIASPRKYFLGCLHGAPRPHRIANYLSLQARFGAYPISNTIYRSNPMPCRKDDPEISDKEKEQWQELEKTLSDRFRHVRSRTIDIPALSQSYIHLTTETTVLNRIFITEKTWKPIAAGQLFLVLGNPGTIAHLRDCGVDVFDDIIDHNSYDNILDWRKRMDRIHDVIGDLLIKDLQQIWIDTHERRQKNRDKFFSKEFISKYATAFDGFLEPHVLRL